VLLRTLQRLRRDDEGTAFVEGAIVVPVMFMVLLGVFEFSRLIYQQHLVSTGIRDAAHFIARSQHPDDTMIQSDAKNLAITGELEGAAPRVSGWRVSDINIRFASMTNPTAADGSTRFRGGPTIRVVTVSTVFTVPSLGFFDVIGLKPPTFSVSHQERVIGPG
jgi:Flp pilus assembly protein TadG